jgi:hypothetical protein
VRKTHLTVLAIVVAVVLLAIGAVAAYADIASDSEKPVTTTNATASYWDAVAITIHATDNEGVAYIYHKLDGHPVRLSPIDGKPLSADVAFPTTKDGTVGVGAHTLKYWTQDINGNVEAQHTLKFEIVADTVAPVTSATAVSVVKGRTATLKYKVSDADPNKGTATVVIKIKNRAGKVVKPITAGSQSVNVALTAKFRCSLARGVYKYYVYATDASGNAQSKVGSARLTVK